MYSILLLLVWLNPLVWVFQETITYKSFISPYLPHCVTFKPEELFRVASWHAAQMSLYSAPLNRLYCIWSEQANYLFTTLPFCHSFLMLLSGDKHHGRQMSRHTYSGSTPTSSIWYLAAKMSTWFYIYTLRLILLWPLDVIFESSLLCCATTFLYLQQSCTIKLGYKCPKTFWIAHSSVVQSFFTWSNITQRLRNCIQGAGKMMDANV